MTLNYMHLKKKFIISTALFITVSAGIVYFMIIPAINNIKNTGNEIISTQQEADAKYNKIINLKKLTADVKKIEPDLAKLQKIFIDKNNQLDFIQILENIAKKNNVDQEINIGYITDKTEIKLVIRGDMNNLYDYLQDIEALDSYINIKNLSVSSADEADPHSIDNGEQIGNLVMNIHAETYWR